MRGVIFQIELNRLIKKYISLKDGIIMSENEISDYLIANKINIKEMSRRQYDYIIKSYRDKVNLLVKKYN